MQGCAVLFVVVLLGVGGCANTTWHKPGSTKQDFSSASDACQSEARRSGYYGILAGPVNMRDFQERCLAAHGWTAYSE
jgi:hypothetical protein